VAVAEDRVVLETQVGIARHFAGRPESRVDRTRKPLLGDILLIALCAVVAGADSREEVERFGEARHGWLKRSLVLPNGTPSHDTFYRVLARLDPPRACAAGWLAAVCEATGVRHVSLDRKTVRSAPRNTFQ
jgi:hypothetical protein